MTKYDKVQNNRCLFEKMYISTQKRETQIKKKIVESHNLGLLHWYIIFYFC